MYQKYMLAAEEILKKISPSQILQQAQIWKIVLHDFVWVECVCVHSLHRFPRFLVQQQYLSIGQGTLKVGAWKLSKCSFLKFSINARSETKQAFLSSKKCYKIPLLLYKAPPNKATLLIRADFRYAKIVKYY